MYAIFVCVGVLHWFIKHLNHVWRFFGLYKGCQSWDFQKALADQVRKLKQPYLASIIRD